MGFIDQLLDDIPIPRVAKIRQVFENPYIKDVEEELVKKLTEKEVLNQIKVGARIAITVGSRGITDMLPMVKTLVSTLKSAGAEPFIIPAMGSHGGATAEGQKAILKKLGITEEALGVPIRATMDTVQVGTSANGLPVYIDRFASEADGIVIINRIKPHVAFRGDYESGLCKMIAIGLGKQKGADICHDLGFGKMAENIPAIAREALAKSKILFGVGILENAYHRVSKLVVLRNEEILDAEPALQAEAKRLAPRFFFDTLDVLIIDEIGKDISGTGFDNNAVGRYHTPFAYGGPTISKVCALDITDKSNGNGNGLGILDFTTRRAFEKFSFENTYPNALTTTVTMSVKIPMVLKNDRQAIQAAIKTSNILDKTKVRLARVKNTLMMGEFEVSESMFEEVRNHPRAEIISEPYDLRFSPEGNLF